jgi:hypothetical protein
MKISETEDDIFYRTSLRASGKTELLAKFDDQSAWERTEQAFQRLNDLIRTRLRLDGIIVG